MKTTHRRTTTTTAARVGAALLALGCTVHQAVAQVPDLAQTPLITASPSTVKPNLMFILDDSGSMNSDYMPDDVNDFASNTYGRQASQCNGLAYNPAITYSVPSNADGSDWVTGTFPLSALQVNRSVVSAAPSLAIGSITITLSSLGSSDYAVGDSVTVYSSSDESRWMIGTVTAFNSTSDTLTVDFTATSGTGSVTDARVGKNPFHFTYNTYTGAPAALSYRYTTTGLDKTTTFYLECNSVIGVAPGAARFNRVWVTPTTINDNFRNWYTYHRTRLLTMRTSTSRVFKGIGSDYRVGFTTINSPAVSGAEFLDVKDFDSTHKPAWYTELFAAATSTGTPLRGALSKTGLYFAKKGKLSGGAAQTYDPMQYSCQKNFAILTTDGYWNSLSSTSNNGVQLDGTTLVGQQDAAAPRPMYDGAISTTVTRTSLLQERSTTTQLQSATVKLQTRTAGVEFRTRSNGNWSNWTSTTSCTPSSSNPRRECRYTNWSAWAETASCTAAPQGTGTLTMARECGYTSPAWTNDASCVASSPAPSAGPTNYTVASATVCQTVTSTGSWVNASGGSCTVSSTKECQYAPWSSWTPWTGTGSCSSSQRAQSSGPNYSGDARECSTTSTGGSTDSLADVAMYYYETDLRTTALGNCTSSTTGADLCSNDVKARGADNATHQHMTTFTLGLGVSGTLGYHPNYLSGQSADFNSLEAGPTMNWPVPGDGREAVNIDDLWHAAVNGRGQYFSAGDPEVLAKSLADTLTAIEQRTGTAAAAATTTLQPVPGDNTEFVTSYTTLKWTGDVVAYKVDPSTGARATSSDWSASARLDARVANNIPRTIYYMNRTGGANTGTLRDFTFANLNTDGLGGHFQNVCSKSPALSQCTTTGFDVAGANLGANMVNWLRGNADSRYRSREHVLSDTVGGAPVYVGKPRFQYLENGYQTFATSNASRAGMVYVPSNGGMLHAIRASDGEEQWAFVPSMVMDRMYRLADSGYASKHEYFVNATPVIGDVWVPTLNAWRTILVGGLGAGGRGYYAIDVTDPVNPQALWEFTNDSLGGNDHLGLTFGNPVITKRADGTWVVMFTSGYNNVSPGDGNGRLFVVDARTGQRLDVIETYTSAGVKAGTTAAPSGLGKINTWVESQTDNTTLRVYGGDFLGNVWRFDIDNLVQPNHAALRLAYLRDGTKAQPITTRPEIVNVPSGGTFHAVVYVGTGVLLRTNDLADSSMQSIYAIKDPLTNTSLGDVRARTDVVEQTLTVQADKSRTVTNHPVDWAVKKGWRVDLPASGERVNIDMRLALTTLVVGTNAPATAGICSESGGQSFLYKFDFTNGSSLPAGGGTVGTSLGNTFVVGLGVMQLYSDPANGGSGAGGGGAVARTQMGDGSVLTDGMYTPASAAVEGRRTSWRELIN